MSARLPTFYLTHGGGPWPYMEGDARRRHGKLEEALRALPASLPEQPKAILVVSGHWEDRDFAVMAGSAPPTIHDYGGFPEELYHIRYPAPGHPALAERAHALIEQAKLPARLDAQRGFDHGTYSILAVTHPQADVPVFQVSIRSDYDPEAHLRLGRALAPLRDAGVLIIGSGSSYHNLRRFFGGGRREDSAQFDAWLPSGRSVCCNGSALRRRARRSRAKIISCRSTSWSARRRMSRGGSSTARMTSTARSRFPATVSVSCRNASGWRAAGAVGPIAHAAGEFRL